MKNFTFNSIKTKLLVVGVLLLAVPLIILGIFSYNKSAISLNELGETNLQNSVALGIEMINMLDAEVQKGNMTLEEAQEQVKTALIGEKQSDGSRSITEEIDLGENGYIFILDENGVFMGHPFSEGKNEWDAEDTNGVKFIQEMIQAGRAGGFTHYDWPLPNDESSLAEKVTYSKTDSNWNWTINGSTYMQDFNQPANEILKVVLTAIVLASIIGIIILLIFTNRIANPIIEVTERMTLLASGDLTQEDVEVKSNDETGQLATALNTMKLNLRGILHDISEASETMSSRSEELSQASGEVMKGSEQIVATMQELASGTETGADRTSELSDTMSTFAEKIEAANNYGTTVQDATGNVLSMTNSGYEEMEDSTEQMQTINVIVRDAVDKVRHLEEQSKKIYELVDVIEDIAAQTNLLALNAAIEAARAGENGQGFAVVAEEVRKLAEEVTDSVSNITDIVTGIQEETDNVAASLEKGYEEVENGSTQMRETGETFNRISEAIEETVGNIQAVTDSLAEIAAESQVMNSSVQDLAAISEQSSAGIQQTTASSQQSTSAMEEVTASSNDLANLAEELNGLVSRFKV